MTAPITTPFPTLEEVADNVGLSQHRARELAALVVDFINTVTYYFLLNLGVVWHFDGLWRPSICHGKAPVRYS